MEIYLSQDQLSFDVETFQDTAEQQQEIYNVAAELGNASCDGNIYDAQAGEYDLDNRCMTQTTELPEDDPQFDSIEWFIQSATAVDGKLRVTFHA